ncbi:acylneuraminate cytidylyltransferase family protein [Rhodospirillales bacterium]|nr:acylneuraminate cytidylyltransferase family protein [Rhodospirillales bacterium]
MKLIAVIPARGGSKGIPGKNLKKIDGVSLLGRCVTTCIKAGIFDQVIVSTNDDAIAAEANQFNAEVVRRPDSLANDSIMPDPAVIHVLENMGHKPDYVCMLQCTSPLTAADDVRAAWVVAKETDADCVFAVTESHVFLWRRNPDGWAVAINHDPSVRLSRQELPETFRETGAFYIMRTSGFLANKHRFFGNAVPFPVSHERSVDVDTAFDLTIAEYLSTTL